MKKYLIIVAIILLHSGLNAQNIYHPWIISAGSNFADFKTVNKPFTEQWQSANWMGKKAPTMLRLGRHVKPYLSVSLIYSTITLETDNLNAIPLDTIITDSYFQKAGLQAEFRFANGKLLKDAFFIDPYIFTGFSMAWIDEESYPGIPGGVGINVWPLDYLGLNFQASYEYLFDFNDYFHYSIGITARFGKMIDKDHDRIADRYDACPKIWGLEEFGGCPDYDHDGVVDSLDQCPKEHGSPIAGGCPDFDKDGISDKQDACPCQAGPKKNKGCPENMTPQSQDSGKNMMGKTEEEQKPLDDTQTATTAAEPEKQPQSPQSKKTENPTQTTSPIPANINLAIDDYLDNIRFEDNSATIKPSSYSSLDNIARIIQQNPEKSFVIQGFTDIGGTKEYNTFLSEIRAKSVKDYFVKKNIASTRLEVRGIGDINETNTNRSEEAMMKNRRIGIYLK